MIAGTAAKLDIRIHDLIAPEKCYDFLRKKRWPHGTCCPQCTSNRVKKNGHKDSDPLCQKYKCKNCGCRFNDFTETVLAKRHHPISVWIVMLYFMGLNMSNSQIAAELDLHLDVAQTMTMTLRRAICERKPGCRLKGIVECDEVYVKAGHKGHPEAVRRKNRLGRRRGLKGAPGRGTLEKEKPPILGIIQRSGDVAIFMLPDVQRKTIEPILRSVIEPGSLVNTDEYIIYDRLPEWGYAHKTVCHAIGEYARDEDGDGFCEVHVNTIEGFWSLLRSWLRPHRGISQENLPQYLGFFEFIHNVRGRGKALLPSLVGTLVAAAA
jgi:transposase-like protein